MSLQEWMLTGWMAVVLIGFTGCSRPIVKLKFQTQPTNTIVPEGSNTTLPCNAVSTGGHVIYDWLIDGSLVSTSGNHSNHYMTNTDGLVITNVQRHVDGGRYQCIATNDLGSILSNQALLQVAYFDKLNDSCNKETFQVSKFESLTLTPPMVSSFPKGRVTWFTSAGKKIQDGDSQDYITSDGALNLIGIQKTTTYRCIVENPHLPGLNCVKSYEVVVSPSLKNLNVMIMKAPCNQTVETGTALVVFECVFSLEIRQNRPEPAGITWYKDNVLLNIKDSSKYGFLQNNSALPQKLLVYNIEMNDAGVYKCMVVSSTSYVIERQAVLQVTKAKDSPPTCTQQLDPVLTTLEGDQEEIECPDDDQDVTCTWYKNARPVTSINMSHVHQTNDSLVFDNMMVEHSGLYQIMLKNNGGECMSDKAIYVKVQVLTTTASPTTIPTTTTTTTTTSTTTTPTTTTTTAAMTSSTASNPLVTTGQTGTVDMIGTKQTTSVVVMSGESTNTYQNKNMEDLHIYIASGSGGFVVLVTVVIVTVICSVKRKRTRKRNVMNSNGAAYSDYEMSPTKRPINSLNGDRTNLHGSHGNKEGVDTKCLLSHEDDALYAPVLALENTGCSMVNSTPLLVHHGKRKADHKYEQPICKSQHKPYNKPLPTLPRSDTPYPRPPSHSYLELLGPTQEELQAIQSKEKEAKKTKQTEFDDEIVYDCAREGVLTNTLKRLTNQKPTIISQPISIDQQPVYQVLEKDSDACANRESTLYATAEDVLNDSDPVYHVLESTRPESVYQSLVDYTASPSPSSSPNELQTNDAIYQPLDRKARSTSAPSSTLLKNIIKPKRSLTSHVTDDVTKGPYSQSCPEYNSEYNSYIYSDDLYQPLNNNQRCPLNVSKPKNSTIPRLVRLQERRGSEPIVGNEPTLHAIDVSPRGSLKENEKKSKKPGHRRNLSDTHTIVNISRRASVGETLVTEQPLPRGRKRNHSDFGLCPIDLSLLRVSIDFENYGKTHAQHAGKDGASYEESIAKDDGKSDEPLYMPLVKSRDNEYSSLNETTAPQ